jgi:hypothetical protein
MKKYHLATLIGVVGVLVVVGPLVGDVTEVLRRIHHLRPRLDWARIWGQYCRRIEELIFVEYIHTQYIFLGFCFHDKFHVLMLTKKGWAIFWAIFQTNSSAPPPPSF